jgi:hypothetical protein
MVLLGWLGARLPAVEPTASGFDKALRPRHPKPKPRKPLARPRLNGWCLVQLTDIYAGHIMKQANLGQ